MIHLWTLGGIEVSGTATDAAREIVAHPDRIALLTYLAVAGTGALRRRDTLLGLFWPEAGEDVARAGLDGAVAALEAALGPGVLVQHGDAEIGLADGAVWCDAVAFEHAVEAARFDDALKLYRGEFLPGFSLPESLEFGRWLKLRRGLLRSRVAAAAWALADRMEVIGNRAAAVELARRAVAMDPDDEAAVRRLVGLLARTGDRAGALDAYGAFATRVAREYGREPTLATQALVAAVRARLDPLEASLTDDPAGAPPLRPRRTPQPAEPEEPAEPERRAPRDDPDPDSDRGWRGWLGRLRGR